MSLRSSGLRSLIILFQMHPYAAGFDDPKLADDGTSRGERKKIAHAFLNETQRRRTAKLQDHDPGGLPGLEALHLPKVAIQCDQRAIFRLADAKDNFVGCTGKILLSDRCGVVARPKTVALLVRRPWPSSWSQPRS